MSDSVSTAALKPVGASSKRREEVESEVLAACERLLEIKPFAQISIEDLAGEAGIQRTAFYFYFANKVKVLTRLVETVANELYEVASTWLTTAEGSQADLKHGIGEIVQIFSERRTLFRAAVEVSTYVPELGDFWRRLVGRFISATEKRIAADQQIGSVRPELDPLRTAEALTWMAERYCYQYLAAGEARDPQELTTTLAQIWKFVLFDDSVNGKEVSDGQRA